MLLLMAVSAAAFLWRFHSAAFAGVVTLYFTALTVMLFTSVVWEPRWQIQIAVGGVRYFSLVSMLPLFHILLTLVDPRPPQRKTAMRDTVLLALQAAILLLTVLVRGSTLPQVAGIALVCLVLAWQYRRKPDRLRALLGKLAVIGLASFAGWSVIAVAVPRDYLTEGRFGPAIWERVTQGLGTNPAWPFAGVNDVFDCKEFMPQGLQPGTLDDNGHCIWFDYVVKHHIPLETAHDKVLDGSYETAMREAFFAIAERYPADVLKTFVFYKPRRIVTSISRSMTFQFRRRSVAGEGSGGAPGRSISAARDRSAVRFARRRAGSFRHWRGIDGGVVADRGRHAFIGGVRVADLSRRLGSAAHSRRPVAVLPVRTWPGCGCDAGRRAIGTAASHPWRSRAGRREETLTVCAAAFQRVRASFGPGTKTKPAD